MSERMELPEGWVETTLGEVISISSGKGLTQVNQNSAGEYLVYGGNGIVGRHIEYLFENKTLIIGRVGVHCGNLHITKPKSWITDNAFVVDFNSCAFDINYLYYHLKVLNLNRYSSSTAQPVISQGKLYPVKIQICPLPEQHRIVAKIEALFSSLDSGIASLKTAQQQLKIYRQAVLKWAFEGKLTNESLKDGELPEGWKWVKVGEVFDVFVGSTPSRKIDEYWGGDINWISSGEVAFCKIFSTREKITQSGLEHSSCKIHPVGTIVMAMIGEGKTRGQVAMLKTEATHNQNTAAIRMGESDYSPDLLYYFFLFTYEKNRGVGSGNNQKALNKERIKQFEIPWIPPNEQHNIVAAIESRLSVCDKLEETILQSLQQAEALRQSILKKAFAGQLVPQDPNDESASVLLERIRAERLKATTGNIVKNKKSEK